MLADVHLLSTHHAAVTTASGRPAASPLLLAWNSIMQLATDAGDATVFNNFRVERRKRKRILSDVVRVDDRIDPNT